MNQPLAPLVWVDFNDMLAEDWVGIRTEPDSELARVGIEPKEGIRVRVYDNDAEGDKRDNLVAEGTLARWAGRDHYRGIWMVHLDYLAHESDFETKPEHWSHVIDWEDVERIREEWRSHHRIAREGGLLLDRAEKGIAISNVTRLVGKVARVGLSVTGMAFGLMSWVLFAYAAIALLSSTLSRWGALVYGGALIIEVICVAWGVSGYPTPPLRLATALGVAGWICAVTNLVVLNVYPAVF